MDVLEGENAAFCVEVEKEEMDIHWYKDGGELRETHQTILKSFGRTHILVFVNTMPQDSGLVTFLVGRSKTSSQLRVKGRALICKLWYSKCNNGIIFFFNCCQVAFGIDQHVSVIPIQRDIDGWWVSPVFSGQTLSSQLSSECADQHRAC